MWQRSGYNQGERRRRAGVTFRLVLCLQCALITTAAARALEACGADPSDTRWHPRNHRWALSLPAGENEARCSFRTDVDIPDSAARFTVGGDQTGLFEAQIRVSIGTVWTRNSHSEDWVAAGAPVIGTGDYALHVSFEGVPAAGFDHWEYRTSFGGTSRSIDFGMDSTNAVCPVPVARCVRAEVVVELVLRRELEGCSTTGTVRGENVSGDYAFWSDNPTGIFVDEDELPIATEAEAQESVEAVAGLDPQALAGLGLDLDQVQAAVKAAQEATGGGIDEGATKVDATAMGLAESLAVENRTFLTLQSVRNTDDLERIGGKPAGIAGNLSLAELAQGAAHILSKFSMTLELEADFDVADPVELWGMQPKVHRAGLVHRGLKFTYPRDGGPTPNVLLGRCPDGWKAAEAVCGKISWSGVAQLTFAAGPGVFSCIGN